MRVEVWVERGDAHETAESRKALAAMLDAVLPLVDKIYVGIAPYAAAARALLTAADGRAKVVPIVKLPSLTGNGAFVSSLGPVRSVLEGARNLPGFEFETLARDYHIFRDGFPEPAAKALATYEWSCHWPGLPAGESPTYYATRIGSLSRSPIVAHSTNPVVDGRTVAASEALGAPSWMYHVGRPDMMPPGEVAHPEWWMPGDAARAIVQRGQHAIAWVPGSPSIFVRNVQILADAMLRAAANPQPQPRAKKKVEREEPKTKRRGGK